MQSKRLDASELYTHMFEVNGWRHPYFPAVTEEIRERFLDYARRTKRRDTILRLLKNGADPESLTFFGMTYCGQFVSIVSSNDPASAPVHGKESRDASQQLRKWAKRIASYNKLLPLKPEQEQQFKDPQLYKDFCSLPSVLTAYADFLKDWPSYLNIPEGGSGEDWSGDDQFLHFTKVAFLAQAVPYVSICAKGTARDLVDLYDATYGALGQDKRVSVDSLERMIRQFRTEHPRWWQKFNHSAMLYVHEQGDAETQTRVESYVRKYSWLHGIDAS